MADNLTVLTNTKKKKNRIKVKSFVERAASSISQLNLFVTVSTTLMPTMSTTNYTTGKQRQQQQDKRDPCLDHPDLTSGGSTKAYYWYQMNGNERTNSAENSAVTPKKKNTRKSKNNGSALSRKNTATKTKIKGNQNNISSISIKEDQELSNIRAKEAEKTSLSELLRALPTVKKVSQITPGIIPVEQASLSHQQHKRNTTGLGNNNTNNDIDLKHVVKTPHKVVVAFMPRVIEVRPRDSDSEDEDDYQSIMSEIEEDGQNIRTLIVDNSDVDEHDGGSECSVDSNRIDEHCLQRNNIRIDGLYTR